ncbi:MULTISPECIES: PP2C family protein-serine/threonine phosphatase [Streptomyces]|uniref:Magnesium or manganese-dependent protein phosphatase n=2 Tax=Streptomyces albus subsp. albus TaxID=67257 RepID=A0A0B5ER98_STRA4|nr:SpoIIE family protein phosphatase [Streptomyces sp. SCSIO ZS0520]AJE80672.1 magnesium or manganese-dependent protein phosphatase [Streptomyces albus]AOU74983.1 magnesium or manganese-dependent protein phosphatase [Streptomyces albus]AYN30792.1 magnesium or manganese-dependent protein phosphatase [Streptomyces albus]
MPSPLSPDRPGGPPPGREAVDALISRTRGLRGEVVAVRRGTPEGGDPRGRWQRALFDLAVRHLDALDEHLAQLRDGPAPPTGPEQVPAQRRRADAPAPAPLFSRVGSAEWNLLTGEVNWSGELYEILGRSPAAAPLTLDELPALAHEDDRAMLTALLTDCLVEAKPIDGEFRVLHRGGAVRTVHMMAEPVLDQDGGTGSMWAVLRDVSELRRSERALDDSRGFLERRLHLAQTEHRLAVELQESVLPPWRGSLGGAHGSGSLDLAARYLPSATASLIGGDWYDALPLPDGRSLLSVGDLTGHGVTVTSGMAMLLGALRGMAVAGTEPGSLLGWLNQLMDSSVQPALGSAVCCRFDPAAGSIDWAQAGHPAPLLFRDGAGRALPPPEGVLLGATSGAVYEQRTERLLPGDVLLLHTDGLVPRRAGAAAQERLLALAPRLAGARSAQACVRTIVEEFGEIEREDDACVLVARLPR